MRECEEQCPNEPEATDWENREFPAWMEVAAEKAVKNLLNFPKDVETTAYKAIEPHLEYVGKDGVRRVRALSCQDEFDIPDILRRKAMEQGLLLDSSAYDNMDIGLPINIPFRVCRVAPGANAPDSLVSLAFSGPFWESAEFALCRYADCIEAVCVQRVDGIQRNIVKVDSPQLQELRQCLESIRVAEWLPEYVVPVLDGWSWSIEVDWDGLKGRSIGFNAAPDTLALLIDCIAEAFGFSGLMALWDGLSAE